MSYLLGLIAVIAFIVVMELLNPPRWVVAALALFLSAMGPIILIVFHPSVSFPGDFVPFGFVILVILIVSLLPRIKSR